MKLKFLPFVATVFALCLTACTSTGDAHEHTYSDDWSFNETYHWHAATCEHKDIVSDKAEHIFNSTVVPPTYTNKGYTIHECTICGYSFIDSEINEKSITITWKNWNGDILETDFNVPYGTMPSYDGETPIKENNSQYSYSFLRWSPEVSFATQDAVYIAEFSETINSYTVTWKNWNGDILETDLNVPFGTMPSFDGTTPTKIGDAQYSYSFTGWSPLIDTVKCDVEYIAQFNSQINTYSVTWKNSDGSVIEYDENVPYGTMPSFDGTTPTKIGDAQYSYSFSGWSPEPSIVTENVVYTAQFISETRKYTVTWKNWNGDILETDLNVPYGTMPSYDGIVPNKGGTAQYTYTFSGWSPSISEVVGDAIYIAQFSNLINSYTVTWKNWNGDILETDLNVPYGTIPSYDGATPTKTLDEAYHYSFSGWSPEIAQVTGDTIYTAQFSEQLRLLTIIYQNYDGTILQVLENVPYGSSYSYTGPKAEKPSDEQYDYDVLGWKTVYSDDPDVLIYEPVYYEILRKYTINWLDWDDSVLETDLNVPYGTTPSFDGPNPNREETPESSFEWIGWTPEVSSVKGDANYKAVYSETTYEVVNITYHIEDCYNTNPVCIRKGSSIILSDPLKDGFDFNGWYDNQSMTGEPVLEIVDASTNIELFGSFSVHSYSIQYYLDGGINSAKNPSNFTIEDEINLKDASKEGYIFKGWFSDPLFENQIQSISMCSHDLCLYAKFEPCEYVLYFTETVTVTLVAEGFDDIRITLPYGSSFDPYSEEIMSNYITDDQNSIITSNDSRFSGWFKTSDYNKNNRIWDNVSVVENMSIYCHFHIFDDKQWILSQAVPMFPSSNKLDLYFSGQTYDTYKYLLPTLCDGNLTIRYAVGSSVSSTNCSFSVSYYSPYPGSYSTSIIYKTSYQATTEQTIRFVPGSYLVISGKFASAHITLGGRISSRFSGARMFTTHVTYDQEVNVPDNINRPGYTFDGWFDENDSVLTNDIWKKTSNNTYNARYSLINYNLNYHLDGGVNNSDNPSTCTIEDSVVLKNPSKEGYTFDGWFLDSSFENKITYLKNTQEDIHLYAKFIPNNYTINFDCSGGTYKPSVCFVSNGEVVNKQTIGSTESLTYFEPASGDNNLIFAGWYLDEECTMLYDFSSSVTHDITLFANWIECDVNATIINSSQTSIENVQINGKENKFFAFVPKTNCVLNIRGNGIKDNIGYLYDETMNLLTSNDDESDENLNFSITYNVEAGKLYYLSVKTNQTSETDTINITFSSTIPDCYGNGTTYTNYSQNVVFGEYIYLPEPTREGYTFVCWKDQYNNEYSSGTWLTPSNIILHAVWESI